MVGVRINKRQRKKNRTRAKNYAARAEELESSNPEFAEMYRKIAAGSVIRGSPPKSKKRREAAKNAEKRRAEIKHEYEMRYNFTKK